MDMVRPSERAKLSESSPAATATATGSVISAAEELIPSLQKAAPIFAGQPLNLAQLSAAKAPAVGHPDRIDPNLGDVTLMLDVNVRRLVAVCRVEEEPIRSAPQDSRQIASPECKPSSSARKPCQPGLLTAVLITESDSKATLPESPADVENEKRTAGPQGVPKGITLPRLASGCPAEIEADHKATSPSAVASPLINSGTIA
jgi:hypothetical protein